MTEQELIAALRDIETPTGPVWWYLAPGWWALAACLLLLGAATWAWRRQRRANFGAALAAQSLRRIRLDFERDGDVRELALRLSRWLKQIAMLAFPEHRLAAMSGRAWTRFLARSADDPRFVDGVGEIFAGDVYRAELNADGEQLIALCDSWLHAIKPRLQRRSRD